MRLLLALSILANWPRMMFDIFAQFWEHFYSYQFLVQLFAILSEYLPSIAMILIYNEKIIPLIPTRTVLLLSTKNI